MSDTVHTKRHAHSGGPHGQARIATHKKTRDYLQQSITIVWPQLLVAWGTNQLLQMDIVNVISLMGKSWAQRGFIDKGTHDAHTLKGP